MKALSLAAALIFLVAGVAGTVLSCTPAESPEIVMDILPAAAGYNPTIPEEDCFILRSTSISETEGRLKLTTSKSMGAHVMALVFILKPGDGEETTPAFWVPVASPEIDYDMSKARFFNINSNMAKELSENYGISYDNWVEGASGTSDKFPCCQ